MKIESFLRSATILGIVTSTVPVRAVPARTWGTLLEVGRAPGSETCPDPDAIFGAIERLFPERALRRSVDPADVVAQARIQIRPVSVGHEALLTVSRPRVGERVILERDGNCRGLADALAVALVVLVEPPAPALHPTTQGASATPPPSATDATPPPSATDATPPPIVPIQPRIDLKQSGSLRLPAPTTAPRQPSLRAEVQGSATGGVGVLSTPGLGVALGLGLFHRSGWGFTVEGLRHWTLPVKAEGGSITISLWAGLGGPCYRLRTGTSSTVDACVHLGIGSQYAAVKGFESPHSDAFPWVVAGPFLRFHQEFSQVVGGYASVGAIGHLKPQSFSVTAGDGTARTMPIADAPKAGLMAELGLMLRSGGF